MSYDVTIGIPVFRSVEFISRTMDSVLAQSYPAIEILVVDDAGHDGSIDVIHALQRTHPRGGDIHVITHAENKGVAAARNQLIDNAQGEYLYFLDSDDMIAPQTIELLMQHARRYDAEMVCGSYEKIETSGRRQLFQYPFLQFSGRDELAGFAYRRYGGFQASACNFLIKTQLLRAHQLHFIKSDYWEDMAFTFNLVTFVERAVLLPDVTYFYICREGSLSHYQDRDSITKAEIVNNVRTVDYLKLTSVPLAGKAYYPQRCLQIVMTDFYMACHILKRRKIITPPVSDFDIKAMMRHPASFSQIILFRQSRIKNLFFYMIGKLPAFLCVNVIRLVGKLKKLT